VNDIQRELRPQDFINFSFTVGITPTAINQSNQQSNLQSAYDWLMICNPGASGRAVYFGGPNVSLIPAINGLEIAAGTTVSLAINNQRQHYEIQAPLTDYFCLAPVSLPFYVWDPANLFMIAAAPTNISILLFKAGFR
jgi:hypothetical protein